jgi:type II secretory pathway pseudopilin PulG
MKFLLLRRALTSGLQAFPKRRAYTLLELLLALALTVLVSGLVGMLLQIYYKSSELSQSEVRQAQIARNLLRMIADDLRSVVRYQEFDDSTLSSVLSASAGGAAGGMSSDSSGASSGDSSGASSGGSSSAGASPGTGTSGGASMGGGSTSSGGSAMGGSSSSSPSSSGSTGSSTTSDTSSSSSEDTAANTTDLAASTTPPPTPGLYGNQYELMVDVSRLPRPDQYYSQQMSSLSTQMPDVPSDIKSVLYYVQTSGNSMEFKIRCKVAP